MRKEKEQQQKRKRGRPAIGKPFLVRLEERHVKRALELAGDKGISAGIRAALERKSA